MIEHRVLHGEVILDLHGFVQDGIGVLVGRFRARVSRRGQHVLADDDHRQQDQLEKRLGYQDTSTTALPELTAAGRLTIARAANAYAHHIVPTPLVSLRRTTR